MYGGRRSPVTDDKRRGIRGGGNTVGCGAGGGVECLEGRSALSAFGLTRRQESTRGCTARSTLIPQGAAPRVCHLGVAGSSPNGLAQGSYRGVGSAPTQLSQASVRTPDTRTIRPRRNRAWPVTLAPPPPLRSRLLVQLPRPPWNRYTRGEVVNFPRLISCDCPHRRLSCQPSTLIKHKTPFFRAVARGRHS